MTNDTKEHLLELLTKLQSDFQDLYITIEKQDSDLRSIDMICTRIYLWKTKIELSQSLLSEVIDIVADKTIEGDTTKEESAFDNYDIWVKRENDVWRKD